MVGRTPSTNAALSLSVLRDLTYFATFERDPAAAPTITLVRDVPNDQGSFVIANWNRSPLDDVAFPGVLCCYRLERTLSSAPGSPWVAASGSITASKASSYSQVVTTPADSMQGDPALRRYRVVAVASGNTGEWISNDIGGYSVDNLAPPAPSSVSGVVASGAASMFWSAVNVPDFAYYAIYRGLEPSPPSDSARRVGTTTATSFNDSPGYFAYYSVTAVDRHGNESPPTAFVTLNSTDAPGRQAPRAFTVGNPFPSPMRGSVSLSVGLPHPMPVTAAVWDSQGRLVRQLLDASSSSGWLTLAWDAHDSRGRDAAPGVYFLRVVTPEGRSVKRVVLVP